MVVSESLKQTSSDKITTCSLCLGFDFLSALAAIKTCLQTARLRAVVFFDVSITQNLHALTESEGLSLLSLFHLIAKLYIVQRIRI